MDVNTLEAGRELDALIAERVMGIKLGRCSTTELEITDGGMICPSCEYCDILCTAREHDVVVRHYSQYIGTAWEVVEKLGADGIEFWHLGREDSCPNWRAEFGRNHQPTLGVAEASTPSLAICRAALECIKHIT